MMLRVSTKGEYGVRIVVDCPSLMVVSPSLTDISQSESHTVSIFRATGEAVT